MGGVGSIIGALTARPLARRLGVGRTIVIAAVLLSLAQLCIPLASGSFVTVIVLLCAQQLVGDCFSVIFTIHAVTLRQTVLRREVLGRANAAITACVTGVVPFMAIAAGLIAELTSIRFAFWIGMLLALAAPMVLWPLRRLKQLPSQDLQHQSAADTLK